MTAQSTVQSPVESPVESPWSRVVLALLALDGVLSAIMGAFLLPLRLGPVPLPVSALLSGLLNVALEIGRAHV